MLSGLGSLSWYFLRVHTASGFALFLLVYSLWTSAIIPSFPYLSLASIYLTVWHIQLLRSGQYSSTFIFSKRKDSNWKCPSCSNKPFASKTEKCMIRVTVTRLQHGQSEMSHVLLPKQGFVSTKAHCEDAGWDCLVLKTASRDTTRTLDTHVTKDTFTQEKKVIQLNRGLRQGSENGTDRFSAFPTVHPPL